MSVNATKIARMGLAGAAIATSLSAALVTGPGASASTSGPASSNACFLLTDIYQSGNAVYAEHFRYCNDNESPLSVAIERRVNPTTWVTVATGSGVAIYTCSGTGTHTYRVKSTTRQVTVPCS